MTYVITQKCVATCDTACVDACPVDAIHGPIAFDVLRDLAPDARQAAVASIQLFIDPETCISCTACAPVCPAEAIYDEHEVPVEYEADIAANEAFFRS